MSAVKKLAAVIVTALALAFGPYIAAPSHKAVNPAQAQVTGADLQAAVAFAQHVQEVYIQILDYSIWLDDAELFVDDYWYELATLEDLEREIPPIFKEVELFIVDAEAYLAAADFTPPRADSPEREESYRQMAALPGDTLVLLKEQLGVTKALYDATLAGDLELYDALSADSMRLAARFIGLENRVLESSLLAAEQEHPQYGLTQSIVASNRVMEVFMLLFADIFAGSAYDISEVDKTSSAHLNRSASAIETSDEKRIAMQESFASQPALSDRDQMLKDILLAMMDNYAEAAEVERSIIAEMRQMAQLFITQQEAAAQGKDIWPQIEGDFLSFQLTLEELVAVRLTLQDTRVVQAGEVGRLLQ